MFKFRFKRLATKALVAVMVLVVALGFSSASANVYEKIPGDALGCIAAPSLGQFKTGLSEFIISLEQGMIPTDPVSMMLAQMGLGNGIDETKGFAVVMLGESFTGMPADQLFSEQGMGMMGPMEQPVVILIGGTSAKEVFAMSSPTEENGYTVFMHMSGVILYARDLPGGYIALSPNPEAVTAIEKLSTNDSMAAKIGTKRIAELGKMGISVSLDVDKFKPLIEKGMTQVNELISFQAMSAAKPEEAMVMKIAAEYIKAISEMMTQLKSFDLGITISGEGLQIDKLVGVTPGSEVAKVLAAAKPSGKAMFSGLDSGDFAIASGIDVGKFWQNQQVRDFSNNIAKQLAELFAGKITPEQVNSLLAKSMDMYTGDYVQAMKMGVSADAPISLDMIMSGVDYDKYIACQSESTVLIRDLLQGLYDELGMSGFDMTFEPNAGSVEGLTVSSLSFSMPSMPDMPAFKLGYEQQYIANPGGDTVVSVSGDMQKLSSAILASRTGGNFDADARVKAAMAKAQAKPAFVCLVDAGGYFDVIMKFVDQSPDPMVQAQKPMMMALRPTCTDLSVLAASANDDMMHGRMFVPAGLFKDIFKAAMMMQQSQMGAPAAGPTPGF